MNDVTTKILLMLLIIVAILIGMTLHELGHFICAKIFKINVKEFSIGIGPKIFSYRTKKGLLISFRLFIFMAYVMIDNKKLINTYTSILDEHIETGYKKGYLPNSNIAKVNALLDNLDNYEKRELSFKEKFSKQMRKIKYWWYKRGYEKYSYLSKSNPNLLLIDDVKLWQKNLVFASGVLVNLILALFFWLIIFLAINPRFNAFDSIGQSFKVLFENMFFLNKSNNGTFVGDIIGIKPDQLAQIDFGATFATYVCVFNFMLLFFNLIPMPPLDGYKIAIETSQKLFKFKVTEKAENIITIIGVVIMLWIFISSVINDFI